jgi:sulfate permease, SulP family
MARESRSERRPFLSLRGGWKGAWRYDLAAGLTLAAIAIPEQMATARLGGFPAHIGFFAFIAGSVAFAALGSNRYLSAGADSTITSIFAGALGALVSSHSSAYPQLALMLALAVGVLLTLAGLFRAGWVADLLSIPVTTGFLAGIAIHIAVSQAPALLGLPPGPNGMFESLTADWRKIGDTNPYALTIGLASLFCIALCEWINPRIPGALIALAAATLAVDHFDLVAKDVVVVGGFKAVLPHIALDPKILSELPRVFGLAVVVAIVVMVQSAAVSRSFPNAPGQSPDVNRDFIGLGAGSLLAGLLGAFPVNASPPRTAIVFEAGGRSQWAAIVACCAVAAATLYGSPLLEKVPEAALAGVLFFVAGRLIRLGEMRAIAAKTRAEFLLVVATALFVTILPVQTGVALAIMLSLAHGVFTSTRTQLIEFARLPGGSVWWPQSWSTTGEKLEGVVVVAFQAPLSFLNAYGFGKGLEEAIERVEGRARLVILEASSIVEIDYTAAQILGEAIRHCREQGVDFAIARLESVRAQAALEGFGVLATLGQGRLFHSVDEATRTLAPGAAVRPA